MRFMCRFCNAIFQQEEIAVPMKERGWVYIRDSCPRCRRGRDDWYVSERMWKYEWKRAVRYCRIARRG